MREYGTAILRIQRPKRGDRSRATSSGATRTRSLTPPDQANAVLTEVGWVFRRDHPSLGSKGRTRLRPVKRLANAAAEIFHTARVPLLAFAAYAVVPVHKRPVRIVSPRPHMQLEERS